MPIISGNKVPTITTLIGLLCLIGTFSVRAQFPLDFQVDEDAAGFPGPCNMGSSSVVWCPTAGAAQELDPDTTPFNQETVIIGGVAYWHQIVGDPAQGFAMEIYIKQGAALLSEGSGGRPSNFPFGALFRVDLDVQSGNGWDPLGLNPANDFKTTGNGTGNPTTMVMRQVLGGEWDAVNSTWSCGEAEFCMDFNKSNLNTKPRITQTVRDASQGFSTFFDMDMSSIRYDDNETAATLINTLTLPSTGIPVGGAAPVASNGNRNNFSSGGSFDMANGTQNSNITGGRYTFEKGEGWINTGIDDGYQTWEFDEGSYSYVDGGKSNELGQAWGSYFDATQNPFPGPGNEGKCDSGAITGSCL